MLKLRLQTKFLLSLLLVTIGLTCATLVVVQQTVRRRVQEEIYEDLHSSTITFKKVQRQRESQLSRSAGLLANLPTLKAVMTSHDAATVQDASASLWKLAGSSLFILADGAGRVLALHSARPGFTPALAQQWLHQSLASGEPTHWCFGAGHLYEMFLQPVYFGTPSDSLLGVLAVGYEVDDQVARDVSRIAGSEVAFRYGNAVVVSTLSQRQESELATSLATSAAAGSADLRLGGERFLSASIELSSPGEAPVVLTVLKSYDQASAFLRRLNRLLLCLGIVAVVVGGVLILIISRTFTRPLNTLIKGVRSLESGDFTYPLERYGDDEVAEVTRAFDRMRHNLANTQQHLLESERLATIGTMASSLSHDLRHSLSAVVANAEFLCGMELTQAHREELYQEIRGGVDQMTELLESLLEFSRTRSSLNLSYANLEEIVRDAVAGVRRHPQWQKVDIRISSEAPVSGWFDEKKLERVFYNLLLNACDAVPDEHGRIEVFIRQQGQRIEIHVRDNGSGIPEEIRDKLFQPFVSSGKQNGTGMGLAVVQKIVQEHGGDIAMESTSAEGTVFRIALSVGSNPQNSREVTASNAHAH